jgi:integrase
MRKGNQHRQPLTPLAVKRLRKAGRHADVVERGLYLSISPTGSRSWLFLWTRSGRRHALGLGTAGERDVSLDEARELARQCRRTLRSGGDPRAARAAAHPLTFGEVADQYFSKHAAGWTPIHRRQWRHSMTVHAAPLRRLLVSAVDRRHVLQCLEPIWNTHPETASRLRGRIERVLGYAAALGHRTGDNPAKWRDNLDHVLPRRRAKRERTVHLAALPVEAVPDLMRKLRETEGIAARALELCILTASRPGMVRGAQWNEIDRDTWTIPASRMKTREQHSVPLSPRCMAILEEMAALRRSSYVFPGRLDHRPINDMTLNSVLHRLAPGVTVHGTARATFRDWAIANDVPAEIAETCLAHAPPTAVIAAYKRSDLLDRRRRVMLAWERYCSGPSTEKVVPIRR